KWISLSWFMYCIPFSNLTFSAYISHNNFLGRFAVGLNTIGQLNPFNSEKISRNTLVEHSGMHDKLIHDYIGADVQAVWGVGGGYPCPTSSNKSGRSSAIWRIAQTYTYHTIRLPFSYLSFTPLVKNR